MRRWKTAAGIALAGAALAGTAVARGAGRRVTRAVERAAAASGASVRQVRFSWLSPLRLEGVTLRPDARTVVTVEAVEVDWRAAGGADPRTHVSALACRGVRIQRGPLTMDLPAAAFAVLGWDATAGGERVRLQQRPAGGAIDVRWTRTAGARAGHLALADLDLSTARVGWAGQPVLEPGRWSGEVSLRSDGALADARGSLSLRGARMSLGRALGGDDVSPGEPADVEIAWAASRQRDTLSVEHATVRLAGVRVEGRGRFIGAAAKVQMDAELSVEAELGAALRTAGVRLPEPVGGRPAARLGTAWLDVSLRGPLGDAAAMRVAPRLRFEPAPGALDALQFLNRGFRHLPQTAGARIDVSAGAADFVPLGEVPPLFVRMMLLSEDAGFFGHPGIDVAEIPAAWATNAERGGFARGASTITQQLARNLFLSRDKSYARKAEEAALALLLDAAVPKARILEIYLNVIEWGPGLHGLAPASRHYFGKDPSQLTAREMAFLVCLVPSPVRYHSAHRAGQVGPGMELLMQNLLAKVHAAGALSEEEYARASEESLIFRPEGDAPSRTEG